jgi:DNA-directed RNA polymerase subunit N (RpoN/RPB10)
MTTPGKYWNMWNKRLKNVLERSISKAYFNEYCCKALLISFKGPIRGFYASSCGKHATENNSRNNK